MLTFLQQHPVYRRPAATKPRSAGDALTAQASNVTSILRAQPRVQAKLQNTTPGDAFEREADRVAGQVMRKQDNECSCGGGCPTCRAAAQKRPATEHQPLSNAGTGEGVSAGVARALSSPGKPIDERARHFFEQRFGRDFGGVRVHDNRAASDAAQSINARAFTVGNHIAFGQGFYAPGTDRGRQLLAHELVHVIQQGRQGAPEAATGHPRVEGNAPRMLARGEKWDAFWGVGPFDALKAKELADKALAAARATGLPGQHNGPGDAWRHCYWNCIMTAEIGRDQAKTIADNHEKHSTGPKVEQLMDLRNNWEGRECGGKNCDSCCQNKLDKGTLDVIEGGKMVPSKKTPRSGGTQSDQYDYG